MHGSEYEYLELIPKARLLAEELGDSSKSPCVMHLRPRNLNDDQYRKMLLREGCLNKIIYMIGTVNRVRELDNGDLVVTFAFQKWKLVNTVLKRMRRL